MTDYPGASSYKDRHGKERWRYRRKGKAVTLPGIPGSPEFEEAYAAAIEGRAPKKAAVVAHPHAALPRSFGAAWRLVLRSPEWSALDPATKKKNTMLAEGFLRSRIDPTAAVEWKDVPIADFRRRHMKMILTGRSETPHAAKHLMTAIRRMITAALDEEWIEFDPTLRMKWRPPSNGWRAWTDEEIEAFEARWSLGTNPRLIFALAIWLGNRRGDVARLRWDQRRDVAVMIDGVTVVVDVFVMEQEKGGKRLMIPVTPMLQDVLDAAPNRSGTVVVTAHGKPFSAKSLTGRMADWTAAAGLPKGCTMHGLRKSLGRLLAEGDASTRQLMDVLGHDNIQHAELYSRDAAQLRLARDGMAKVVALRRRG